MSNRDDEDLDHERNDEALAEGRISKEQHALERRRISRFYRDLALDAAESAAREAYDRELERW